MAALLLLINIMFGGDTTISQDQYNVLSATPDYQAAYAEDPTATQAIVIIDQNEF